MNVLHLVFYIKYFGGHSELLLVEKAELKSMDMWGIICIKNCSTVLGNCLEQNFQLVLCGTPGFHESFYGVSHCQTLQNTNNPGTQTTHIVTGLVIAIFTSKPLITFAIRKSIWRNIHVLLGSICGFPTNSNV